MIYVEIKNSDKHSDVHFLYTGTKAMTVDIFNDRHTYCVNKLIFFCWHLLFLIEMFRLKCRLRIYYALKCVNLLLFMKKTNETGIKTGFYFTWKKVFFDGKLDYFKLKKNATPELIGFGNEISAAIFPWKKG